LQIEKLCLGGCNVGKKPADCAQLVKEFFSMAVNLSHINFANTLLPADLMKAMLLGLASNQQFRTEVPKYLFKGETCTHVPPYCQLCVPTRSSALPLNYGHQYD
ncbi:hypothetical protein ANCDUO_26258, partial [Ancylostoma duodenale]